MKKIQNTQEAFVLKIQSLYDIEKQLEKALPKLAKASSNQELKNGFLSHLEETKGHSERLEKIFEIIGEKPKKEKCEGIRGIIQDGDWVTKVNSTNELKDSMIAAAARYAEHYEMAGYMCAIKMAEELGMSEAADLLSQTLVEEEAADEKLANALEENFAASPSI